MNPFENKDWPQRDVDLLKEIQGLALAVERMRGKLESKINEECGRLRTEIATLKGKASVWGAVAGLVVSLVLGIILTLLQGGG